MSSVNSRSSDGGDLKQQQRQFVSLVKQRHVSGVKALLQSMSSDEARSRLYQATSNGFEGVFKPWWDSVRSHCLWMQLLCLMGPHLPQSCDVTPSCVTDCC